MVLIFFGVAINGQPSGDLGAMVARASDGAAGVGLEEDFVHTQPNVTGSVTHTGDETVYETRRADDDGEVTELTATVAGGALTSALLDDSGHHGGPGPAGRRPVHRRKPRPLPHPRRLGRPAGRDPGARLREEPGPHRYSL